MTTSSKIMLALILVVLGYGIFLLSNTEPQDLPVPSNPLPSGFVSYTNNQYHFSLAYPQTGEVIVDKTEMANVGYLPTCDIENAIVCIFLPPSLYPTTNFQGAGVSVNILSDTSTEASCVAPRSDLPEDPRAESVMLNDNAFTKYSAGDAAMSHQSMGADYRTFYNNTCYEITTRTNTTTFEVYEPGSIGLFTDTQKTEVGNILLQIVQSFEFN